MMDIIVHVIGTLEAGLLANRIFIVDSASWVFCMVKGCLVMRFVALLRIHGWIYHFFVAVIGVVHGFFFLVLVVINGRCSQIIVTGVVFQIIVTAAAAAARRGVGSTSTAGIVIIVVSIIIAAARSPDHRHADDSQRHSNYDKALQF